MKQRSSTVLFNISILECSMQSQMLDTWFVSADLIINAAHSSLAKVLARSWAGEEKLRCKCRIFAGYIVSGVAGLVCSGASGVAGVSPPPPQSQDTTRLPWSALTVRLHTPHSSHLSHESQ